MDASMNMDITDGTGYQVGDAALAFLVLMCAVLTYLRCGFEGRAMRWLAPRMAMGIGFTIWAGRMWYAVLTGADVIIAPVSMVAISMITSGYCAVQLLAIRRAVRDRWNPVYCLQDPTIRCAREDRIKDAMR